VQLRLPFLENEDPARIAAVWAALPPEEQTAVVTILVRLMVKIMESKENNDE
jgi:hypothetical protein